MSQVHQHRARLCAKSEPTAAHTANGASHDLAVAEMSRNAATWNQLRKWIVHGRGRIVIISGGQDPALRCEKKNTLADAIALQAWFFCVDSLG